MLRQKYPTIRTIAVQSDLSKLTSVAECRELFESAEMKDIDIGFIALNAGTYASGPIDMVTDADFEA